MSEDNTKIIENQKPIISLDDLNKRKEFFSVIQNIQQGEPFEENSLRIISNIDGNILSLIEKLISLRVCTFNGLSFYEFYEKQELISEEELSQLIALKEIGKENVVDDFTAMMQNFFMLSDLNEIKTNITERIKQQIERLKKKFSITFEEDEDNGKLIFTQQIKNNKYKIVISRESNPSNMDFFYNDIHVLRDKMPEKLDNYLVNRQYPQSYASKISEILTRSQHSFYVLPNLQINPNFNQKIIFSGNIIGEFKSVPCLLLMEHLGTENSKIKFLIGSQETISKDTPQNTSLILRRLVKNDILLTGIIMENNYFSYNIFLPSHLPKLFKILQDLRNEDLDLPVEYKESWQIQFDKLSLDLQTKIDSKIPFIKKNDEAKFLRKFNRNEAYIYSHYIYRHYKLYLELKNKGFTDKDLIEIKNAIGNIFFDLSYLDEGLIKTYLSDDKNYDNWLFGKINSIPDKYFFDINQNISDDEPLKTKYYRVTQTKIDIENQTKNITLSTGKIINNESYSYQKFYKAELCFLFKILVMIYKEFVFSHNHLTTLSMIYSVPKYFNKLTLEQQEKVKKFCEDEEKDEAKYKGDYTQLNRANTNYPYKNHEEIFENQIAKFESLNDKLKAFLINWDYYIKKENLDISNNYEVLYEKLMSEHFSETELFEINFAVNNFLCDLVNTENDGEELFGIKFAAEIAQDFTNKLMALKNEQNEISDANSQSELAGLDVDNFSVIQHINESPNYNVIVDEIIKRNPSELSTDQDESINNESVNNESEENIKCDINENNNSDVNDTENNLSTNENNDKNLNKNEPTNQNSTPKNFKLGIGLSIVFTTLAIISGALIFLSGFFTYFVVSATIFTIAAITTSSKTTDMYRDEKAENKYSELKNKNLSNEEIKKQMPKDLLWRKKWHDRFPEQPESEKTESNLI